MAISYALHIKDRTGAKQATLAGNTQAANRGGYRMLAYRKQVNAPGMLTFQLDSDHPLLDDFDLGWQVEAWRWDNVAGIDKAVDFYGLYWDDEPNADDDGNDVTTVYCVGQMDWLARSIVAYPADTNNRSVFTNVAAETVMKTLVTRNATLSGTTADGRIEDVPAWGSMISVQADDEHGNMIDYACFGKNLLEALQDVAYIGGLDFDLVKTGGATWEFRTYAPQLGTDKSGSVIFSQGRGNMRNPTRARNRMNESTVAIAGGQGLESNRLFAVRTGANYNATWNSRETFVQATEYTTVAGLEGAADRRLAEVQSRDDIQFQAIETPATRYQLHYELGDLVTASYRDTAQIKKIAAVVISFLDSGGAKPEEVSVETQNV